MEQTALEAYEEKQMEIEKMLRAIRNSLLVHDRNASGQAGGHHWGHVGDLNQIACELADIQNRLAGTGEYALLKK